MVYFKVKGGKKILFFFSFFFTAQRRLKLCHLLMSAPLKLIILGESGGVE